MDLRFLGKTGVKVSRLALGCMSFGGDADEATAGALYARARDAGVNFFDTADVYNDGRSEQILGRLSAGHRDEIVVATKAYFPTAKDANARGTSRYHLVRACEASLRRLGREAVDVYYLHRWDDATALDETLRAIDDLVRSGKVLYAACSNFAAWQVAHALGLAALGRLAPLVAIQPMYNLLKRQAEVELLPMAQALGLAVVPYSPTAGGLLTGKWGRTRRPDAGRMTTNKMYQTRYAGDALLDAADQLVAIAAELGVHPAALAVAWAGAHPAVTSVLLGARDVGQLDGLLGADTIAMTPELRARIAAITPAPPPATDRSEETSEHNYGAR
ncbi:MAG TPA: aldo/keto reductase [Kofleriaceae bacterium]|nr:aldo/keto reductase [Kofleriaceae bacterium]